MRILIDHIEQKRQNISDNSDLFSGYEGLLKELEHSIMKLKGPDKRIITNFIGSAVKINRQIKSFSALNDVENQVEGMFTSDVKDKLDSIDKSSVREYFLQSYEKIRNNLDRSSNIRLYAIDDQVKYAKAQIKNKLIGLSSDINNYCKLENNINGELAKLNSSSLRLRFRKKSVFRQMLNNYYSMLTFNNFDRISNYLEEYIVKLNKALIEEGKAIEYNNQKVQELFNRTDAIIKDAPDYYTGIQRENLDRVRHDLLEVRSRASHSEFVLDKIINIENELFSIERSIPLLEFNREVLIRRTENTKKTINGIVRYKGDKKEYGPIISAINGLRFRLNSNNLKHNNKILLDCKDKLVNVNQIH